MQGKLLGYRTCNPINRAACCAHCCTVEIRHGDNDFHGIILEARDRPIAEKFLRLNLVPENSRKLNF